jgi:hypothetical protein
MQLPVRRELQALVLDTLAPALEAVGFSHRKPMDFVRPVDEDLAQVVSVQVTGHGSQTFTSFTLNLAIFVPEFFRVRGKPVPDRTPGAEDCHGSARSGRIVPRRSDEREFWYDLGNDGLNLHLRAAEYAAAGYDPQQPATLRALLRSDLSAHVVPFLAPLRSRRQLLHAYRATKVFEASQFEWLVLELAAGELDAARSRFQSGLADRQHVCDWAQQAYRVDLRAPASGLP